MGKERLDALLVQRGLAPSREQAKRLIMAGLVYNGTELVDKPGTQMKEDAALSIKGTLHPFVSRGGLKLEKALRSFGISLADRVVVDVGASTGGFTDCALKQGAALVYSVDVGYGQLAWELRINPRVRVMERVNFRHVSPDLFDPAPDAAVMDVSFISIAKLFPKLLSVLRPESAVVTLIKPQFEAGPSLVGKGGVVRDRRVHESVVKRAIESATEAGFSVCGLTCSPILGGDGNVEFLMWLQAGGAVAAPDLRVAEVVAEAHALSAPKS